jgi:hypothetical protein
MTTMLTAIAHKALFIGARTTIVSCAAHWVGVRVPAAPFGAGRGSSAPTRWKPLR